LLKRDTDSDPHPRFGEFTRPPDTQQAYFDGLEVLRGHLSRCLGQIANMDMPSEGVIANYIGPWDEQAYIKPSREHGTDGL